MGEEIGATLAEKVQEYGILIDKFNIINFDFSAEFNDAIEQKQVAEQNKLRAETEKEQKIIEAQADAEQKGHRRQGRGGLPSGRKPRQRQTPTRRSTHR